MTQERAVWIDWLRVISIFLVVIIHSTEPFYLGGSGTLMQSSADAFWVALFDSFARACVPLFIIASSYLQLPLKYSTKTFFKKRAVRILVPFLVWTVIYALIWGEPVENFQNLIFNFNYAAGHLWFVYMLIGVYLIIPLLSPWAEKVSRKELLFYLAICFIASFIPLIRQLCSGDISIIIGPSGIPAFAKYPLWGEASWNSYGVFYYLSGFIGYVLLGLYVRRFAGTMPMGKVLLIGLLPWIAGFIISFVGFLLLVYNSTSGVFPFESDIAVGVLWETPWIYDSTGVMLMALGWVIIIRKLSRSGFLHTTIIVPLAKASYGVYLCHMLILAYVSGWIRDWLGTGADISLGFWTTPVEIILSAVVTFTVASMFSYLIGAIPKAGKYLMG